MDAARPPSRLERLLLYCPTARPETQPLTPVTVNNHSAIHLAALLETTGDDNHHRLYIDPFRKRYAKYNAAPIQLLTGDNAANWSSVSSVIIAKSRRVGDGNVALLPLNRKRHWQDWNTVIDEKDRPWTEKRAMAVWRGATTGNNSGPFGRQHPRHELVRRWFDAPQSLCDVGYSKLISSCVGNSKIMAYLRDRLSIEEQLRYKYVVSVDGNDVATNLKWILLSNSIPLMPVPRVESWLLESQLKPMVHYVPLRADLSDLDKMIGWCRRNDRLCRLIAENGKTYIRPFLQYVRDRSLETAVIERYLGSTDLPMFDDAPFPPPPPPPKAPPLPRAGKLRKKILHRSCK